MEIKPRNWTMELCDLGICPLWHSIQLSKMQANLKFTPQKYLPTTIISCLCFQPLLVSACNWAEPRSLAQVIRKGYRQALAFFNFHMRWLNTCRVDSLCVAILGIVLVSRSGMLWPFVQLTHTGMKHTWNRIFSSCGCRISQQPLVRFV